jgi:hypothetical protein
MERFVCLKDLASAMELDVRSVKRWARRLEVPPTVPGHSSHRWSTTDADRFLQRWKAYWRKKGKTRHGTLSR